MIMADVFKILFPVIGTLMSAVCFWLMYQAVFPQAVERCRKTYEDKGVRAFFLGALLAVPSIMVAIALLGTGVPPGQFAGFSILFALMLLALLGSAGFAQLIGHRLPTPGDVAQPWKRVLRGGIILSLTFLFPMIGWFFVIPATLISGVGVSLYAIAGARRSAHDVMLAGAHP